MPALVAVMIMVVVATHHLVIGVVAGVLIAMTLFARRVAHLTETDASTSRTRATS